MKKTTPLSVEVMKEAARQFGRKGGRPRTVAHEPVGYCRCAECRASRQEAGRVKESARLDKGYDWGS